MKNENSGQSEKISVIVPVYGEDEYIGECIKSIVNQTYTNLEIILVDDGSPDKCPIICDDWKRKDKRVRVIHKENGGLVSARQAGIEVATGKYITYVDGDDWIEPQTYMDMMEVMQENDVDIVITGFQKDIFGKSIPCYNKIKEGIYDRKHLISEVFPAMICEKDTFQVGLFTYVWNKLFKKDLIYQYQMKVDKRIVIGEDSACVYPALLEAEAIAITSQTGYHYRQRMDSLLRTTKNEGGGIKRLQLFYDYMKKIFEESLFNEVLKEQIFYFYVSHMIMMSDNLVKVYPGLGKTFPFMELNGERLIIYSAGAYGIHVYNQFRGMKEFKVVAWIDPDYEYYDKSGYDVVSVEKGLKEEYDYILVASVDREYIADTIAILKNNKVDEDKIISIFPNIEKIIESFEQQEII